MLLAEVLRDDDDSQHNHDGRWNCETSAGLYSLLAAQFLLPHLHLLAGVENREKNSGKGSSRAGI